MPGTLPPRPTRLVATTPTCEVWEVGPLDPEADHLWRGHWRINNDQAFRLSGEAANMYDPDSERAVAAAGYVDDHRTYVAVVDGAVAVSGFARRDLEFSPERAWISVVVDPAWEHRGLGRDVLRVIEEDIAAAGATLTEGGWDVWPGMATPARPARFAAAAGYRPYQSSVCRVLDLPLGEAFRELAARHTVPDDYRIETVEGPLPADWLVGYSESSHIPSMPKVCHQGDTLVISEHRGHKLGMALKLATIARIAELVPSAIVHRTSNAAENIWMIRTNEELGYRVDFEMTFAAKDLAGAPVDNRSE